VHLDFQEVRKIQDQVQRISHSVTFNPDGSFTCRRRYQPLASPEIFAIELQRLMQAAQNGKIRILEKRVESFGPGVQYFLVRFKPLR
jgi:hypothetical protein